MDLYFSSNHSDAVGLGCSHGNLGPVLMLRILSPNQKGARQRICCTGHYDLLDKMIVHIL